MICKVIKLKLQYFKHVNVQVTCQRDPEVYAACHDHKIYLHTKFGIPTSNCIQICSGLDLARTKTRGQGHSKLETVGDSPVPKMYLHTKYGTATVTGRVVQIWTTQDDINDDGVFRLSTWRL